MTVTSFSTLFHVVSALMLWHFLCLAQCKLNKRVFLANLQSHWSRTALGISAAADFQVN